MNELSETVIGASHYILTDQSLACLVACSMSVYIERGLHALIQRTEVRNKTKDTAAAKEIRPLPADRPQ
jgi:hypothetical protein